MENKEKLELMHRLTLVVQVTHSSTEHEVLKKAQDRIVELINELV